MSFLKKNLNEDVKNFVEMTSLQSIFKGGFKNVKQNLKAHFPQVKTEKIGHRDTKKERYKNARKMYC